MSLRNFRFWIRVRDAVHRFVSGMILGQDADLRDARRCIQRQGKVGHVTGFPGQRDRVARIELIPDHDARPGNRFRQAIGNDAGSSRIDVVLRIELEDLGREEIDLSGPDHRGPVFPEAVIDGGEGQAGRSVMKFQGGGVHGNRNRLAPDARFRVVDGGKDAGPTVLGDDDLRVAETPARICESDVKGLLPADDGSIRADLNDGIAAFPDGKEKPPASTREQDETPDDIPEFTFHRLLASWMNWVRYSHFAGAMQGQKPFPDGNHNGFVKKAGCCVQASSLMAKDRQSLENFQDSRPCLRLRRRWTFKTF